MSRHTPSICFLLGDPDRARNDNHRRLPEAFERAGWRVARAALDTLTLTGRHLAADTGSGAVDLRRFDRLWVLGFGRRESTLDRLQLLSELDDGRFINGVRALTFLHAKYHLALSPLADHYPETYASTDARALLARVDTGGTWIAKDAGGSYGRDVYRLERGDPNTEAILGHLTGHDGSRYCLLQRYVEPALDGETRVLAAAGTLIGAYRRVPPAGSFKANLAAGGSVRTTVLSDEERSLAERVVAHLETRGVGFVAVDLAFPWIMEINIANPGGLGTLAELEGTDPAPRVVAAVGELLSRKDRN